MIPSRGMEATFFVPGVSCSHCVEAITSEVAAVAGVRSVDVDLEAKTVTVVGDSLDDDAVVAAIDDAGYDVVR
jgi:copper chaperone CopZ